MDASSIKSFTEEQADNPKHETESETFKQTWVELYTNNTKQDNPKAGAGK